jgi:hypothetical protein
MFSRNALLSTGGALVFASTARTRVDAKDVVILGLGE